MINVFLQHAFWDVMEPIVQWNAMIVHESVATLSMVFVIFRAIQGDGEIDVN